MLANLSSSSAQGLGPLFSKGSNFPDEYYLKYHRRGERGKESDPRTQRKGLAIMESSNFRVKRQVFEEGLHMGRFLPVFLFLSCLPAFLLSDFLSLDLRKTVGVEE